MRLILASQSATRRRMLEAAGVSFESVAPGLDEDGAKPGLAAAGFGARDMAEVLAELKAKNVASAPATLILGADQTLELDDGSMLSKPGSRAEAHDQLRALSGRTHWLHSSAVIAEDGERSWAATESVALSVRPLGERFIEDYLDREYEAVRWNVGGYRIEGAGSQLFAHIEGSHFAILGLPLIPLLGHLRERGLLAA